jgi:uncharacterized membrane protein
MFTRGLNQTLLVTGLEYCRAMSSEQKSAVRIFLDHLYFSVCCVLVGFLLVYGIAKWSGHGFDIDDNMAVCVVVTATLSLILTSYFTIMSVSRAPSEFIVRTKRTR